MRKGKPQATRNNQGLEKNTFYCLIATKYTKIVFFKIYRRNVQTRTVKLIKTTFAFDPVVGGDGGGGVGAVVVVVVSVSSNGNTFRKSPNSLINVRIATETAGSIVFDWKNYTLIR